MQFEESKIIDSNGSKFKVGLDAHGWFTIDRGRVYEQGGETMFESDDSPLVSFTPDGAVEVADMIDRLFR